MTPPVLTAEVTLFLLIAGLLGVVSVATFRFAAAMTDAAALRARDARRIRLCHRASTLVLAISAVLSGIGALSLATGW
jgi:hypothetical protein